MYLLVILIFCLLFIIFVFKVVIGLFVKIEINCFFKSVFGNLVILCD